MRSAEGPEAGAARAYHEATKHSRESVRRGGHVLDWQIKPLPFKIYPEAPAIPLPREVAGLDMPALDALRLVTSPTGAGRVTLDTLSQLLFFAAGLTKRKSYPTGEAIHFRAAASTGALYEVEVYAVAGALPDLEPGVYHFCPGDFTLRRLRSGDCRESLAEASGEPDRVRTAPVTLVLSAIYWRNTWKYQARAFRHFFWDAGTMLANFLATAVAIALPTRILLGFADAHVNHLLGLDGSREGSLALVPVGEGATAPTEAPPLPPLALSTVPLSTREVDYPLVQAAYEASSLRDGTGARAWSLAGALGAPAGSLPRDSEPPRAMSPNRPLGEVILRRGSTRQFAREEVDLGDLATILDSSVRRLPLDVDDDTLRLVEPYLLVHAVRGLPSGAYVYECRGRSLRRLRVGAFRAEGGDLCLEQPLGADASAVVFFLTDLRPILARFGNRGYRAVNLAAGLVGGRMYLAAYALGLGASGSTFYDDDVVRFFSPDAAGKDAIFVTALGRAHRQERPRGLAQAPGELSRLQPGER